jgi:hypothetical protein
MTPGTAAGKRKTVSFPDHVMDNEEKRPLRSGLPDDCPGKFPSPWVKTNGDAHESAGERSTGRSKLTEQLEQVRDESAKRSVRLGRQNKSQERSPDYQDQTLDLAEPRSDSGKYWKQEYDIYRENTTREVKKLVAKQKAAKNFARDRDLLCMDLEDELEEEKQRTQKLESRTRELEAKLKEYEEKLQKSQAAERIALDELHRLKQSFQTSGYGRDAEASSAPTQSRPEAAERLPERPARKELPPIPTQPLNPMTADTSKQPLPIIRAAPQDTRSRSRARNFRAKPEDDMWAPSTNVSVAEPAPPPPAPKPQHLPTRPAAPLQPLNTNTVQNHGISVALSMGMQPPSPDREREREPQPQSQPQRHESPQHSPAPRVRTPEPHPPPPAPTHHHHHNDPPDPSILLPPSSPFDPDTTTLPQLPPSPTLRKSTVRDAIRSFDAKENIAPGRPRSRDADAKPSVAWTAMTGAAGDAAGKRVDRGREVKPSTVSAEALAKARERLRLGGRQVS